MRHISIDCSVHVAIPIALFSIGNLGTVPTITNVQISDLVDVSFKLSATIGTSYLTTSIKLEYGPTLTYGNTIILDNITGVNSQDVEWTVTGLLPYWRTFFRIVATNSLGSSVLASNVVTLEPVELTDGNWVAIYDATYEKNVMSSTTPTQLVELRDKQYDCALGDDLFNNTTFDNSTGWTLSADMTISGGSMNFNNAAVARNAYAAIVGTNDINPVHVEATNVVITEGSARVRVSYGTNYIAGVATTALPAGNSEFDMCYTNNIAYVYVLNMTPYPTTWSIGGLRIRKIRGKHLINPDTVRPTKGLTDDFITFTGTQRIIGYSIPTIGSTYAFVKRTGIDSDYVLRTDLTSIGQHSGTTFTLGANSALSTFYPMQLRRLAIRTVVDNTATINKLTEWFSRKSYEIPPAFSGVLGTGVWADQAIWDDNSIPITI